MDKGEVTRAMFMDLKKVFDSVNHGCLLHKLPYYSISGIEIDFIKSYLFNRGQIVTMNNIDSDCQKITHGVPQGSILGPLLFVLLINDLPLQLKHCHILMYADDTVIYLTKKISRRYRNTGNRRCKQNL